MVLSVLLFLYKIYTLNKWLDPKYIHNKILSELFQVTDENGIKIQKVGNTYQADHAQANGNIAESAIDHVYTRSEEQIKIEVLKNSSYDHVPVVCILKYLKNKN